MSIPPVNYSVPPPPLNIPPPQLNIPPPVIPTMSKSHLQTLFNQPPPPFPPPIVPTDVPPPSYVKIPAIPLHVPPPITVYPPPPIAVQTSYPPPLTPLAYHHGVLSYKKPPESIDKGTEERYKYQWSSPSSSQATSLSFDSYDKSTLHGIDQKSDSGFLTASGRNSSELSSHLKEQRVYTTDSSTVISSYSSSSSQRYERDESYERENYRKLSRSPTYSFDRYSRSPSRYSSRRGIHNERISKERYYDRKRIEYERRHNSDYRSHSRSFDHRGDDWRSQGSPDRRYRSPEHRHRLRESRYRSPEPRYRSPENTHRTPDKKRRTPDRKHRSPDRRYRSPDRRFRSPEHRHNSRYRESHSHSRRRELSPRSHSRPESKKPLTDREKILEDYRKNYCKTSEDLIRKMEEWSKEHNSDEENKPKMWYRSSPAELYYKVVENGPGIEQTPKLEKICESFLKNVIERGRKARPGTDEQEPLRPPKRKVCNHRLNHSSSSSSSSSSSESEDCFDEDGLQGFTDRIMLELQRKQNHPRRLHPELWFNNTGEMNGGPLCRCSARARRQGIRHGVFAGEQVFPKCIPTQNNIDKLYHYCITVSPPTNFLIKSPTIIAHDEHEFLFSGFSIFSHYKLAKLPKCKVIRFNIEYTILYVEEPVPTNFTIQELNLFEDFLFTELLELIDLDLGKGSENSCSQFHFMPRFVRYLPEGGCEVLSMCEVLKYLLDESGYLISPEMLKEVHDMEHYSWQKFVDRIKGMIVTYPGKKPCSLRVDQLDRSPPLSSEDMKNSEARKKFYPEIVHFGIRPPQLSYCGNPEYQKAWRYYVKYRHLIANMSKPSYKERQRLAAKEAALQEMRTQNKMKRDVTVAISSEGFHTTGLMCDVVQHAMLIPVLVRHLRFHKSLDSLEEKMNYTFKQRALLQTALTHPSYRENFGTNPDHARNSLSNCGIRQPEYGDRRIHYTRKKGIVTLINIMSRFGRHSETESEIKHNERLEFLGDAVVEFISSIHLFRMFPGLAEGGLATYRAAIVQNQHLAQLAKNIGLEEYMLYAHGSDLCREVVMRHAMANCFEALMGALFLDGGLEVTDRVFSWALWYNEDDLLDTWSKDRYHPLQEQEPLGDRHYIKDFEFLQRLTEFEDSIGVQFKHIRLLARAFTDRSVGYTNLTLGSNQRLEFLGDTVVQLVVSDRLYRHFPDHHEGHLSLLRSSLVNNRTQSMVCDDLNMSAYAMYNNPKSKPTTKKHKADLLEAFLGALYVDKNLEYCQAFCNACLFPRLQEFIMNQDWNDPKSKLQQCCLTLRSMEGGEPNIPFYKVIECLGPTNTRVYTVGVYFRGTRLAAARGHSIQEAEMNAAEEALNSAHELFPQLDHQKRVIAKRMRKKKSRHDRQEGSSRMDKDFALKRKSLEDRVPKAYRLNSKEESSDESSVPTLSDQELNGNDSNDDSGLDSDSESQDKFENVQVSSLVSDMERIKEDFIKRNEYDKLKEKCFKSDSDSD